MPRKKEFGSAADAFLGTPLPATEDHSKVVDVKPEETKKEQPAAEAGEVKKPKKEIRTKSVIIRFTPSLHEKIRLAAAEEGLTFSAYVTTVLMKAVK